MNQNKFIDIAKLMMTYSINFDNVVLTDNLKCVKCKLVLKYACQVPCGCRYCRKCIDDMIEKGDEFCPEVSEECKESVLSYFVTDYNANNTIGKLVVKCPNSECLLECRLANMEDHLRVCRREAVKCIFSELGCEQDQLSSVEMGGHFHQQNHVYDEMLIGMIANINNEMAELRRSGDDNKKEIQDLKQELLRKDKQNILMQNEIKSIKVNFKIFLMRNKILEIKDRNEDFVDKMRILSEKIDEWDNDNLIECNARQILTATAPVESSGDVSNTPVISINNNIQSMINQDIDATGELIIDSNFRDSSWVWPGKLSDCFHGSVYPYKYRFRAINGWRLGAMMWVQFFLEPGPNDEQLVWPFTGAVTVTVADQHTPEKRVSSTQNLRINNPSQNRNYLFSIDNPFKFRHSSLFEAGIDPDHGLLVSCQVVPSCVAR